MWAFVAAAMFVSMASAQTPNWFASVHPDLSALRYPPLARQARIHGTVRLSVTLHDGAPTEITMVAGHPLLVPAATENLKKWRFDAGLPRTIVADYSFVLTDSDTTSRRILRGDSLDRLFLRIFRRPVYRDIQSCKADNETRVGAPIAQLDEFRFTVPVSIQIGCLMVNSSRTD
jgi:hypothetical protein